MDFPRIKHYYKLLYIVMSRKGNKESINIYSNALFICIKQSITIYSNEPLGDPDSSIVHLDII